MREPDNNSIMAVSSKTSPKTTLVAHQALGLMIEPNLAVADTGATSFFFTNGAPCQNKRHALNPISITLPDGRKIMSTHVCDINIPGLPTTLTGHIALNMPLPPSFEVVLYARRATRFYSMTKNTTLFTMEIQQATFGHSRFYPMSHRPPSMPRIYQHLAPVQIVPCNPLNTVSTSCKTASQKRITSSSCTKACATHPSCPF